MSRIRSRLLTLRRIYEDYREVEKGERSFDTQIVSIGIERREWILAKMASQENERDYVRINSWPFSDTCVGIE